MAPRWLTLTAWVSVAVGAAGVGLAAVSVVRDVVADDPVQVLASDDVDRLLEPTPQPPVASAHASRAAERGALPPDPQPVSFLALARPQPAQTATASGPVGVQGAAPMPSRTPRPATTPKPGGTGGPVSGLGTPGTSKPPVTPPSTPPPTTPPAVTPPTPVTPPPAVTPPSTPPGKPVRSAGKPSERPTPPEPDKPAKPAKPAKPFAHARPEQRSAPAARHAHQSASTHGKPAKRAHHRHTAKPARPGRGSDRADEQVRRDQAPAQGAAVDARPQDPPTDTASPGDALGSPAGEPGQTATGAPGQARAAEAHAAQPDHGQGHNPS